MTASELTPFHRLKISLLADGIRVHPDAELAISQGGTRPLSIHEYATTGGVTLELPGGLFVNAPFDDWYCDRPRAELNIGPEPGLFEVRFEDRVLPARVLPLPGYLNDCDDQGRPVTHTTMSHVDRIRVSPIYGCAFACRFCDFVGKKYARRPAEQLLAGLQAALNDTALPPRHVLISGGTPSKRDYDYIDDVYEQVIRSSPLPVDVMLAPRPGDILERLVDWGAAGFAINLEVYDPQVATRLTPQKKQIGLDGYARFIERAVALTGGGGRVRSLILVGLESEESTLTGVEFLARLGCDPTLSPFRPARGTPLADCRPPTAEQLERIYLEARQITARHNVRLGPRCIPCQHNTLTFPEDDAYYYS